MLFNKKNVYQKNNVIIEKDKKSVVPGMKSGYVSSVDLLIEVFLYAPKGRHIKMAPSVCPAKSCSLCHVQATTFLCMDRF